MANITSLDQNIRDKAVQDFENKLSEAAKVFKEAMGLNTWAQTSLGVAPKSGEGFRNKSPQEVLDVLVRDVVKVRTEDIGNKAVKAFVTKVEMLEDQINEVREIVEYGN